MIDPLDGIGMRMLGALPPGWVYRVIGLAKHNEGVSDLVRSWAEAETDADRDDSLALLQECLDDEEPLVERGMIRSASHAAEVVSRRRLAKEHLRRLVDSRGGVSEVARLAEMPQPSLSRLLSSGSLPRASTLARLAHAMGVSVSRLSPTDDDDSEVFDFVEERRIRYFRAPLARRVAR